MVKFVRPVFLMFVMMSSMLTPRLLLAAISVHTDRSTVHLNESFQLVFESDEEPDSDPDFSPLEKDFEILGRSQSSNFQIINSSVSRQVKWTLNMMAKQAGSFTIPAISFDSDQSAPARIRILEAQQAQASQPDSELFLEVEAKPQSSYLQAQVLYTLRLYRAVSLSSASLSEPKIENAEAVIEKLGDDREFETTRNGKKFIVIERRYAIFPQQSGRLKIEPVQFEGQIPIRTRNAFDPFGQSTQTRRLRSEGIELDIKPVPPAAAGSAWLPASDLQLVEQWPQADTPSAPQFKVGEPLTRTVAMIADGLTAAQLPELNMAVPDGFKAYPDQATLNDQKNDDGIIGVRQEKVALIPTRPGSYTLPALEIKWWNTKQQRQQTARLPERVIQVMAAEGAGPTANSPAVQAQADTAGTAVTVPSDNPMPATTDMRNGRYWPWLSLALAAGWLFTAIAWWRRGRPARSPAAKPADSKKRRRDIERRLKQSCLAHDAGQTRTLLLDWAQCRYPGDPPVNLGELARRSQPALATAIDQLSESLYSAASGEWDGKTLWQAIVQESGLENKKQKEGPEILAPLHP